MVLTGRGQTLNLENKAFTAKDAKVAKEKCLINDTGTDESVRATHSDSEHTVPRSVMDTQKMSR